MVVWVARTLEKMLLLPTGILRSRLVTEHKLNGEALGLESAGWRKDVARSGELLTLLSGFWRNSMNAWCTSWSTVRPMLLSELFST